MAANTNSLALASASTQYALSGSNSDGNITGNISIWCWAKFASVPGNNVSYYLVSKWGNTNSYLFRWLNNAGQHQLSFFVSNSGSESKATNMSAPDTTTWHHYAITWTAASSTWQFYYDGVAQGAAITGTKTAINSNTNDKIAVGSDAIAESPFDGKIAEVQIYSSVFAPTTSNYQNDPTGNANLQLGLKLNNAYTDVSTNAYTFTGQASPTFSTDVPFANYKTSGGILTASDI